jgi:tetratricopeptide (TPR) repeat protein
LTTFSFSFIFDPLRFNPSGGRLPSLLPDLPAGQPLTGQLVVFTGKLSSLGRREARVLVANLGGATADEVNARTTMLVVGAEASPLNRDRTNKLKRAEELNAQQPRQIQIVSEDTFCRLAGVPTPETLKRQYHAMRDLLARYDAVREDHLRYLVKCGVLRPVLRTNADTFFAFPDVAIVKQLSESLEQGVSFRSMVRAMIAARQGQLELDFRIDAAPAKILSLRRPADRQAASRPEATAPQVDNRTIAEQYFRAGSALDDGDESRMEDAAAAYRKALEFDPHLVAALINLANIHYSHDELVEAQALYERAISFESDFFEAHFNLGNIHHDLGRFPEAQSCYHEALRLNPFYAEAHFYLAVTFEKMGLSQDARPHWRSYQQLAPQGEWVELAREFSES